MNSSSVTIRFQKAIQDNSRNILLLGFIAYLICYSQLYTAPFYLNEQQILLNHPLYVSFELFLSRIFTLNGLAQAPLTIGSFALQKAEFGADAGPSYFFNVVIHSLVALLLFSFLRRRNMSALPASLLFLLHPLAFGAVGRVFGRAYLLGTLCLFLSLYFYDRSKARNAKAWKVLSIFVLLLAPLFKQSFVVLPLVFFVLTTSSKRINRSTLIGILAFCLSIILIALPHSERSFQAIVDGTTYATSQLEHLTYTLQLFLFPTNTAIYHDLSFVTELSLLSMIVAGGVVAFFLALLRYGSDAEKRIFLAACILLMPTNSIFAKNELIYEWRLYSCLPFVVVFSCLLLSRIKYRTFLLISTILYLGFFVTITFRRVEAHQDGPTALTSALARFPQSRVLKSYVAWQLPQGPAQIQAIKDSLAPGIGKDQMQSRLYIYRESLRLKNWSEAAEQASLIQQTDRLTRGAEDPSFYRATSVLTEWGDGLLVMGNWSGKNRPYLVYGNTYSPLLDPSTDRLLSPMELYSVQRLPGDNVLLLGQIWGRAAFDLIRYSLKDHSLELLSDRGMNAGSSYCATDDGDRISFADGSNQVILDVQSSDIKAVFSGHAAYQCLFLGLNSVLTIKAGQHGSKVERCSFELSDSGLACDELPHLSARIEECSKLYRSPEGRPTLEGRVNPTGTNSDFRVPYRILIDQDKLQPEAENTSPGDLIRGESARFRTGYLSEYRELNGSTEDWQIIRSIQTPKGTYGIISNKENPPQLAREENSKWSPIPPPDFAAQNESNFEEVWLRTVSGLSVQSYLSGTDHGKTAVIWLHGGPYESFSPRFNPYVNALTQAGISTLAVNYPGSTTRGGAYERLWRTRAPVEALAAAHKYLNDKGFNRIFIWSISSASSIVNEAIERGATFSGWIDQAGFFGYETRLKATRLGIPVLPIRGSSEAGIGDSLDGFIYDGGHDLIDSAQFSLLKNIVTKFIRQPPVASASTTGR